MSVLFGRKFKLIYVPTLIFSTLFLYFISQNHYQIRNTLSYATRPIWDSAEGPSNVIPHYYSENLAMNEETCKLHGWALRKQSFTNTKVLDAVLMSSELDLLEIRMNELDAYVDRFFIVESNATFTGLPKETYFANNRARFSKFDKKISYRYLPGYPLKDGQEAFDVEAQTRNAMTSFLRSHITELPPDITTLIIMSDLDEIPSAHTVKLLKACDFGDRVHLQLRNFLYSFEWFIGMGSWRASVHKWGPQTYYRHSQSTNDVLADSGWHCSYCFRFIPEYIVKMRGFSHSDRIGGKMELLDPERIQETICNGKDIFGMLPEAFSYADLLSQMRLQPQTSAVGLPLYILEHADKFRFLLPGGCRRESPSGSVQASVKNSETEFDDLER